jgi:hypothetical protein
VSQPRPQLYTTRAVRVAPAVWVLAKYAIDNNMRLVTRRNLALIWGKKNNYTHYYDINRSIRLGLLRRVKLGLYEVNLEVAARIVSTMIPFRLWGNMSRMPLLPQWKEAFELAEAWARLSKLASDGTSPPARREAQEAAAAALGGVIETIKTPSGDEVKALVRGDTYIILEGLKDGKSGRVYCVDWRGGAKLCAADFGVLVRYATPSLRVYSLSEALPIGSVKGSGCGPAEAAEAARPSEGGMGSVKGGRGVPVFVANVVLGKGSGMYMRRVDPLAPPPEDAPPLSLVFDNVRWARDGVVHQMRGLQALTAVSAASAAGKLVYAEPGIQVRDEVLYELSKLMDIHIYHSAGKDPKGVVRIEGRPRAKALRKFGLGRLLAAFMTFLHRLAGVFDAVVDAWFR